MKNPTHRRSRTRAFACSAAITLLAPTLAAAQQIVSGGSGTDYQPSILRAADGDLVLVFERLDASLNGDLWVTRSSDDGVTWSTPTSVIATGANERHPSLLQLGDGSFVLFYLKGSGAVSGYRLFRATSSDGANFTEQGQLALGGSGGQLNPHVIRQPDGTLTMSYQRFGSGSYLAQSSDNGASWDQLQTTISTGSQLPRIAYRASDGRYLATYQTGASELQILARTTTNVRDWSEAPISLTSSGDNHDSLPVVMPDGAFAVFYIHANDGQYDLYSRRSLDGAVFEPALTQHESADASDVEPHPLVGTSASHVQLYWGREVPGGALDYDIVRLPAVAIADGIFADGFE
jgi:hypothetical protein